MCAAKRPDVLQLKTINYGDCSLDLKAPNIGRCRANATVQSPSATPSSVDIPRLLIVKSSDIRGAIEPSCHAAESRIGAVQVSTAVCRLLGDLLALRCCCQVRVDGGDAQPTTNNNDICDSAECDESYRGPTALVVIHSKPPPVDLVGLEDWLSDLHPMKSTSAKWIGLEHCLDDENANSLAVYQVYFSAFDYSMDIDVCR
jgi:hypothetical protein